MNEVSKFFPIAVIEDRYTGLYSKGSWLAISCATAWATPFSSGSSRITFCLEDGPSGTSAVAREFWAAPPNWIVSADTPDEAVYKLGTIVPSVDTHYTKNITLSRCKHCKRVLHADNYCLRYDGSTLDCAFKGKRLFGARIL